MNLPLPSLEQEKIFEVSIKGCCVAINDGKMLEPLSSDAGNAQLRACLEGSTQRGTQAPGGGQRGIGK